MQWQINPQHHALQRRVALPPSKSNTLRALLFASLAAGESTIQHALVSPDTDAMVGACRALRAEISRQGDGWYVTGVAGNIRPRTDHVDVGNSGQVLRFVAAVSALSTATMTFSGDLSIQTLRPVAPLLQAINDLGGKAYSLKDNGYAPIAVLGPIQPGTVNAMEGADSQPVSAILIAASLLQGTTRINVVNAGEKPWVALTLHWLRRLGVNVRASSDFSYYEVEGGQPLPPINYRVSGDYSSAVYPAAAAIITKSTVAIEGLDPNESQPDKRFLDHLSAMGANVSWQGNTLVVSPGQLFRGIDVDLNDSIDTITILAVLGCFAQGKTTIRNAGVARNKECDRIASITRELKKMGAAIVETTDGLVVEQSPLIAAHVDSYNDHRIALALAVAALGAKGTTIVNDVECTQKSFPLFWPSCINAKSDLCVYIHCSL
ncbi:3-phosphoshikimate 1-carboxyvinyltransferase [Simkania negevensis]|uniref:3-phosphoshikimate 1-carboxyvinyltransferase n=1 Tax=Simkania negevensis TaxID=83561 RepID=A0ABS3ASV0_9BACT|nr:3-phosphoshikimate 1-carboxyvinyltransferase [Simkania negevensis]